VTFTLIRLCTNVHLQLFCLFLGMELTVLDLGCFALQLPFPSDSLYADPERKVTIHSAPFICSSLLYCLFE
jgi:hypothetical protein